MADRRGDASAGRVLADEDARTRGRAERAGGVGLSEARATLGQAIDIRGLVEGATEAAEIMRAQVVGEDEDHVRLVGGEGRERGEEACQEAHRNRRGRLRGSLSR